MIDAVACEPQFVDHLASVWLALPTTVRGRFIVDDRLYDRARAAGIEPTPVDAALIRSSSRAPDPRPGDGPVAFVVSIGDTKVARRMGYRRFLFMEHGAGQSYLGGPNPNRHPSYAGGGDREDFSLFLVPNLRSAADWMRAYPSADVRVVGCPKLDALPRREAAEAGSVTVAISFHWPGFVAPEADTALGFYVSSLRDLARRYHVIGHAHPKADWPQRMARVYERAGIEFVPEFDDVCRRADVYVCDNSSTIFEFAATGRPVVLLNSPAYRRNVEHGLRFWEAASVGVNVDRASDLFDGIDRALRDAPEDAARRDLALGLVYAVRSDAAQVAAGAIVDHLRLSEAA